MEAQRQQTPFALRGAGHSCGGQTVTEDTLVLNEPGSEAPVLGDDGLVDVPSGCRWRQVERHLNARGRSIPVLADYLDLSVGGTLSVGGYGAESIQHGAQVDHVEQLRLVTPDGSARWCSPSQDAELFSFALAGLGQVGAIARATIRTVPHHRFTTLLTSRHPDLKTLIGSMQWLADGAPPESCSSRRCTHAAVSRRAIGAHARTWSDARDQDAPGGRSRRSPLITTRYRQWRHLTVSLWLMRFAGAGGLE